MTDSLPRSVPAVDAAVRMQEAFPGAPTPARVVVWRTDGGRRRRSGSARRAIDELRRTGRRAGRPWSRSAGRWWCGFRWPAGGTDDTSNAALNALRDDVLPATLGEADGVDYAVGRADGVRRTTSPTRCVTVARSSSRSSWCWRSSCSLVAFRSVAIPVVSIVLNLLSIGAAYGVLTWVFQDGHLARCWASRRTAGWSAGCRCSCSSSCSG